MADKRLMGPEMEVGDGGAALWGGAGWARGAGKEDWVGAGLGERREKGVVSDSCQVSGME